MKKIKEIMKISQAFIGELRIQVNATRKTVYRVLTCLFLLALVFLLPAMCADLSKSFLARLAVSCFLSVLITATFFFLFDYALNFETYRAWEKEAEKLDCYDD